MKNVSVIDQANEISTLIDDAKKRITEDVSVDISVIQGKVLRLYENVANQMSPMNSRRPTICPRHYRPSWSASKTSSTT